MNAMVLQRANHLQTGAVAHMRETRILMTAEIALKNAAIFGAVKDRAPGFQFADASGRFFGVEFGHPPVIDVLPAAHGIGEVNLPVVAVVNVRQRRGNASFGHNGVRFAKE